MGGALGEAGGSIRCAKRGQARPTRGVDCPAARRVGAARCLEPCDMGVSYRQLRERCQLPVRQHNDVAGLLFGDFASLPITKLFVDLRWSPNIATLGMLVCG